MAHMTGLSIGLAAMLGIGASLTSTHVMADRWQGARNSEAAQQQQRENSRAYDRRRNVQQDNSNRQDDGRRREQARQQQDHDRQRNEQARQQRQQQDQGRAERRRRDEDGRREAARRQEQQRQNQAERRREQADRERSRQAERQRDDRQRYRQERRRADERLAGQRDRDRDRNRNWSSGSQPRYGNNNSYRDHNWNRWHDRYAVRSYRRWDYDRRSRPWFDFDRHRYIYGYRPSYVIGYSTYPSYGYGGPVACNRDVVGALLGGAAGGYIGAQSGDGFAGAIVGAILGGALGRTIDLNDQACIAQVLEYAPSNQAIYWEDDGAQYQVTPLRTFQTSSGRYCREYQTYIYIDGEEERAYGTACRQPDGTWQLVS